MPIPSPINDAELPSEPRAFDTLAVRGGEPRAHAYGAVTTPIACTATYAFADTNAIRAHFEGHVERFEYGRYGNPTVQIAERKLAALEGTEDALLFPSGMSAITTLLLSWLKPGDHVVLLSESYRQTRAFVTGTLAKFGVRHTLVDPADLGRVEAVLAEQRPRLIVVELPTNPHLRVVDLPALAELKRRAGARLIVDSTLATPFNIRPSELGADVIVHSCTKYLAGHNDVLAGALCGRAGVIAALREARGGFGGMPDPHGAYLLIRGLKTLGVRMRQHNLAGARIARFLEAHEAVERVFYPGLASAPDYALATKLLAGFGGVVSFEVRGDLERCARFVDACRLATIGASMCGVETLVAQPALMSYYELSSEERQAIGIPDNLVRLSVGLEDVDELIADLDRALKQTVCG